MNEILERTYLNNSVLDYLIALGIILLGFILIGFFKRIVLTRLQKLTEHTATSFDNYIVEGVERFGVPALYITIIYVAANYLVLSDRMQGILRIAVTVVVTVLVIRFISMAILFMLRSFVRKQSNGEEKVKQLGGLMLLINVMIWFIGIVFL